MFENNVKETQTREIHIKDVTFEAMETFIDYCYGKEIRPIQDVEAIKALPVSGSVKVPEGVSLSRPIQVDTSTPLEVNSDVNVDTPIVVSEVSNPVSIRAVDGETLQVSTPDGETLNIIGGVKVNSVGGKINVRLRDAAQSLLPVP